jgi:CTP synthase (UTP-ammonia lyase)
MPLESTVREKISNFTHVPPSHVLNIHDCSNIWHVPLLLKEQGADKSIMTQLGLQTKEINVDVRNTRCNDAITLLYRMGSHKAGSLPSRRQGEKNASVV